MKHKGRLSITRPRGGSGPEVISIRLVDDDAGIEFVQVEVELAAFSDCLTGLADTDCEFEVRGLENVGKRIERETIEFLMPDCEFGNRKSVAKEEAMKVTPEGWTPKLYFGSQDSFFQREGKDYARTHIVRWVNK